MAMPLMASTIDDARKLIAKGEKREAWAILYPIAKTEGSAEAQYLLGYLLLNSPGLENYLNKALVYFRAAERSGHRSASVAIDGVKRQIQARELGHSTVDRSTELYERNREEFAAYSKRVRNGFVTGEGGVVPHKLDVFVIGGSQLVHEVTRIVTHTPGLSSSLSLTFNLVINQDELGNTDIFPEGFQPPPGGFVPDIDGALAAQLGVKTFPSLALQVNRNSDPKIISLGQFRTWANQWSPNQ